MTAMKPRLYDVTCCWQFVRHFLHHQDCIAAIASSDAVLCFGRGQSRDFPFYERI